MLKWQALQAYLNSLGSSESNTTHKCATHGAAHMTVTMACGRCSTRSSENIVFAPRLGAAHMAMTIVSGA
eukprot:11449996-Karenia_brevis.AAC.1